jgi:uncharacterized membrane protein YhaH (DUF805 family)
MRKILIRITIIAGLVILGLLIAASGTWSALALNYNGPHNDVVHTALAVVFALASLTAVIALFLRRWRWRALSAYLVLFAVLLFWYSGIKPTNDSD